MDDIKKLDHMEVDELYQELLLIKAYIALLHPIDLEFNVDSNFLEGVKQLSFNLSDRVEKCIRIVYK